MVKGHTEGKRRMRRIICGFEQDTFDHIASKAELEEQHAKEIDEITETATNEIQELETKLDEEQETAAQL